MEYFAWQCIEFEDGSNPYICKTEKEFDRIKKKYGLVEIKQNFWLAKNERVNNMFYADLLMEQQEQM